MVVEKLILNCYETEQANNKKHPTQNDAGDDTAITWSLTGYQGGGKKYSQTTQNARRPIHNNINFEK